MGKLFSLLAVLEKCNDLVKYVASGGVELVYSK